MKTSRRFFGRSESSEPSGSTVVWVPYEVIWERPASRKAVKSGSTFPVGAPNVGVRDRYVSVSCSASVSSSIRVLSASRLESSYSVSVWWFCVGELYRFVSTVLIHPRRSTRIRAAQADSRWRVLLRDRLPSKPVLDRCPPGHVPLLPDDLPDSEPVAVLRARPLGVFRLGSDGRGD
jgi:hypothetical protein